MDKDYKCLSIFPFRTEVSFECRPQYPSRLFSSLFLLCFTATRDSGSTTVSPGCEVIHLQHLGGSSAEPRLRNDVIGGWGS